MYATIQEVQKKQKSLEEENIRLRAELKEVAALVQFNKELIHETVKRVDKIDKFVEEFDNTFTAADIQSQKHSLQQLQYSIEHIKANLLTVKEEVDKRTAAIYDRIDNAEGCQSGTEIGEHTYPAQSFPLERTVKFDRPFQKVPAFSFGTTLLDSTSHLSVHVQLRSLTPESFTIYINTWGGIYALYGARISWMACPK